MSRVFISYRHVKPDEDLASFLEKYLSSRGQQVFIDRQILVGIKWVEEIERQIRGAEHFVVLLSKDSIRSDMVRQEVKLAHELMRQQRLTILPIRVAFLGELPLDLACLLNPIQYTLWNHGEPFDGIAAQIFAAIEHTTTLPISGKSNDAAPSIAGVQSLFEATEAIGAPLPQADPRFVPTLETGTLKLDSPFYVQRRADAEIRPLVVSAGATVVVNGPRQIGKSSLLARARGHANAGGVKTCYLDFQLLDQADFTSLETLLRRLMRKIARAFKTAKQPNDFWDTQLGAKDNLTNFMEETVLAATAAPILLLLDEADLVFNYSYRDDFFGMLRGWHDRRATEDNWNRFNLVIAHSTEPYLWIQDINQSPFNVGHRLKLDDFDFAQVAALNVKHGRPQADDETVELMQMIGGHPYLVRQALYALAANQWTLAQLQNAALDDSGPFGDHLRRFLWRLQQNQPLRAAIRQVLENGRCDTQPHFHRLYAAGLLRGSFPDNVRMRCRLYEQYFKNYL